MSPASVVVGAMSVLAAAAAGWWAFAAPAPPPVEEVLPRVDVLAPPVASASPADTPVPEAGTILVHVAGAVVRPGVHELSVDARVVDAIDAAAGLLADADRERLNLAAPLLDGQRVWIPRVGEEEPPVVAIEGGGPGPGSGVQSDGPVDLNRADQAALESLPGIGPSIAGAIIEHRERDGPFERVEDLLEVAGIGPSRMAQLESLVVV